MQTHDTPQNPDPAPAPATTAASEASVPATTDSASAPPASSASPPPALSTSDAPPSPETGTPASKDQAANFAPPTPGSAPPSPEPAADSPSPLPLSASPPSTALPAPSSGLIDVGILGKVETLTDLELIDYQTLETIVVLGWQNFAEAGTALAEIRDRRLYRAEFGTFEEYCRVKWRYHRAYVYRLIAASQMFKHLSTNCRQNPPQPRIAAYASGGIKQGTGPSKPGNGPCKTPPAIELPPAL